MKKTIPFAVCLLTASLCFPGQRSALARQTQPTPLARVSVTTAGPAIKHLYLKDSKTHLIVQQTQRGTRVYRQIGQHVVPMN